MDENHFWGCGWNLELLFYTGTGILDEISFYNVLKGRSLKSCGASAGYAAGGD